MENIKAILTPNPVMPGHIIKIDPEKCIACYECVATCRSNVIMDNPVPAQPPVVVYPEECWMCACCTENCPTGAIRFEHPTSQKVTWKRKETGEFFRIGMKNPPEPYTRRAYGDLNIRLQKQEKIMLEVLETEKATRYVTRIKLGKTTKNIPKYRAGSFCNIRIDDTTHRGYSMANIYNPDYFELYIDTFSEGTGVCFLSSLKKGITVEADMPYGRLCYTAKATPLLLIGSVTGISPIKAILEEELLEAKTGRPIKMIFQVWDKEDVFLKEYFDSLARQYTNFSYEIVLGANGKKGEPALAQAVKNVTFENGVIEDSDAYICGSKQTIKTVESILLDRNVFWRNIYYESFQK